MPQPIDEVKNAVDTFEPFAKKAVAQWRTEFRGPHFWTKGTQSGQYEIEIGENFSFDCKKSDSLISPVAGEITVIFRGVNSQVNLKVKDTEWNKSPPIKCSYRNGQWFMDSDVKSTLGLPSS